MIQRINTRTQSPVKTENPISHDRSHGEVVEGVGKVFPDVGVAVFSEAFVVESVAVMNVKRLLNV